MAPRERDDVQVTFHFLPATVGASGADRIVERDDVLEQIAARDGAALARGGPNAEEPGIANRPRPIISSRAGLPSPRRIGGSGRLRSPAGHGLPRRAGDRGVINSWLTAGHGCARGGAKIDPVRAKLAGARPKWPRLETSGSYCERVCTASRMREMASMRAARGAAAASALDNHEPDSRDSVNGSDRYAGVRALGRATEVVAVIW